MALTAPPPGPVQAPPPSGLPPSCPNRLKEAALLHTVMVPFEPASGAVFTPTVTVAEALEQGGVPDTV